MNRNWVALAGDVPDIWVLDLSGGVWGPGDQIILGVGMKFMTITLGTQTEDDDVAFAVYAAWSSSSRLTGVGAVDASSDVGGASYPEFVELTTSVTGSFVTFTATTAGKPVELWLAQDSDTTGVAVLTNTQPATGKNHWDNADNWEPQGVPQDADHVILENSSTSIKYGLPTTGTAPHLQLRITQHASFTAQIGLPPTNRDGNPYTEYRQRNAYLGDGDANGDSIWTFGVGGGLGSDLINLSFFGEDGSLSVRVHKLATPSLTTYALNLSCSFAERITVNAGTVNLSPQWGNTTIKLGALDVAGGTVFYTGNEYEGDVVSTISGGAVSAYNGTPADSDAWIISGSAVVTFVDYESDITIKLHGGRAIWNTPATVSLEILDGGFFDAEQDDRPFTVQLANIWSGATIGDAGGRVGTWTDGLKLQGCDLDEVTLRLGNNRRLAITDI